jgi:hypothetical protein
MHTILKGSEWVLSAERGAGAPESMYGVECLTCRAESGWVDNDPKGVEVLMCPDFRGVGSLGFRLIVLRGVRTRLG